MKKPYKYTIFKLLKNKEEILKPKGKNIYCIESKEEKFYRDFLSDIMQVAE